MSDKHCQQYDSCDNACEQQQAVTARCKGGKQKRLGLSVISGLTCAASRWGGMMPVCCSSSSSLNPAKRWRASMGMLIGAELPCTEGWAIKCRCHAHIEALGTNRHKQHRTCLAISACDMGMGCTNPQCARQFCPAPVSVLSTQRSGQVPPPPTQPPAA